MTTPAVLFATVLQQFWCIITNDVVGNLEQNWLARFQFLEKKSGTEFLLDRFLSFMHHMRMASFNAKNYRSIPSDAWAWPLLLPYFKLLSNQLSIAPIFRALGDAVYQEALKTQEAVENIENTHTFSLRMLDQAAQMRRYWQMLCDGTNQFVFTTAFILFLNFLLKKSPVPLRWSLRQLWLFERCYMVDGVIINAKTCLPNCPDQMASCPKICSRKYCWQRSHCWLLFVLRHEQTNQLRIVNFDLTSAILSADAQNLKSRNIGCIPINCGFMPYIWQGSEKSRDEPAYVERPGDAGKEDAQVWKALQDNCRHLDDSQLEEKRLRGETFYTVSGANRLQESTRVALQLASTVELLQGKLACNDTGVPQNRDTLVNLFLNSTTLTEIVQKTSSVNSTLSQMLNNAVGILDLVDLLMKKSV